MRIGGSLIPNMSAVCGTGVAAAAGRDTPSGRLYGTVASSAAVKADVFASFR